VTAPQPAPLPVVFDVNVLVGAVVQGNTSFRSWPSPPPVSDNACADCVGIVNDAAEFSLWLSPHILRNTHRVVMEVHGFSRDVADSYIAGFKIRYVYDFWRPVTAIRNGDQDGNDATERDAGWTSFNPTPMHPEYPSQATLNATIVSAVLESVFGPVKAIPFTATDVRDPKRTRQFSSLADMAEEQKNVRVWGGVHYSFAIRTSEDVGRKVAAYMLENSLKPAR
jgi:hypothetical protein